VVHWPTAAEEHQAHDDGLVLMCVGDGRVVLGLVDGLGAVLGGLDGNDGRGRGLGAGAGPDCAAQRSGAILAGHFGAVATDTRLSVSDDRQA
jgi:hypothetical protein